MGGSMNKEKVMELAHKHNALVIQQGVTSATEEWLTTFANAVIAAHTEELLQGVGEPDTHCFDEDTQKDVWSYSKEAVAAAVAQAYKQGKHDEEMAQGPSEFEGWERDRLLKRIATLESTLKVAQDGLASIHTATAGSYSNIQEVLHAD